MRKVNLLVDLEVFSFADGNRRGGPFAHAVEREDGSPVERRRVERGGCVAQMMLAEGQALRPVEIGLDGLELVGEQRLLKQLLPQPQRQRHAERREAARAVGEVGLQQALEFDEWFVVEDDAIDVLELDVAGVQAIVDCEPRVASIEFFPGEALFLCRGNDAAVLDQRCGAVVIERRETENAHARAPQKIV